MLVAIFLPFHHLIIPTKQSSKHLNHKTQIQKIAKSVITNTIINIQTKDKKSIFFFFLNEEEELVSSLKKKITQNGKERDDWNW